MSALARFEEASKLNMLAFEMKCAGIATDQRARASHSERLNGAILEARKRFRDAIGDPEFDLPSEDPEAWDSASLDDPKLFSSHVKLKRLYFQRFRVKPTHFNKANGQPMLDEKALKALLANPTCSEQVKVATRALLMFRENHKTKSTFVDRLDPEHPQSYLFGGRLTVHPNWSVLQAKTGRWACSDPNLMQVQKGEPGRPTLRDIYVVRDPANFFVEADYSQLEVRIIAALSCDDKLLAAFNTGSDVYKVAASDLFAVPLDKVTKQQRDMTKMFILASNYGGGIPVIHGQMVVNFPAITPLAVEQLQKRWFATHPEIPAYQARQFAFAKKHGYVEAPISKKRLQFYLDRIKPTEAANFPIQGSGADIINPATLAVREKLDWGREYLILQVHDALYLEGKDPVRLAKILRDAMQGTVKIGSRQVFLKVDIKVGKSWGEMTEVKDGGN